MSKSMIQPSRILTPRPVRTRLHEEKKGEINRCCQVSKQKKNNNRLHHTQSSFFFISGVAARGSEVKEAETTREGVSINQFKTGKWIIVACTPEGWYSVKLARLEI